MNRLPWFLLPLILAFAAPGVADDAEPETSLDRFREFAGDDLADTNEEIEAVMSRPERFLVSIVPSEQNLFRVSLINSWFVHYGDVRSPELALKDLAGWINKNEDHYLSREPHGEGLVVDLGESYLLGTHGSIEYGDLLEIGADVIAATTGEGFRGALPVGAALVAGRVVNAWSDAHKALIDPERFASSAVQQRVKQIHSFEEGNTNANQQIRKMVNSLSGVHPTIAQGVSQLVGDCDYGTRCDNDRVIIAATLKTSASAKQIAANFYAATRKLAGETLALERTTARERRSVAQQQVARDRQSARRELAALASQVTILGNQDDLIALHLDALHFIEQLPGIAKDLKATKDLVTFLAVHKNAELIEQARLVKVDRSAEIRGMKTIAAGITSGLRLLGEADPVFAKAAIYFGPITSGTLEIAGALNSLNLIKKPTVFQKVQVGFAIFDIGAAVALAFLDGPEPDEIILNQIVAFQEMFVAHAKRTEAALARIETQLVTSTTAIRDDLAEIAALTHWNAKNLSELRTDVAGVRRAIESLQWDADKETVLAHRAQLKAALDELGWPVELTAKAFVSIYKNLRGARNEALSETLSGSSFRQVPSDVDLSAELQLEVYDDLAHLTPANTAARRINTVLSALAQAGFQSRSTGANARRLHVARVPNPGDWFAACLKGLVPLLRHGLRSDPDPTFECTDEVSIPDKLSPEFVRCWHAQNGTMTNVLEQCIGDGKLLVEELGPLSQAETVRTPAESATSYASLVDELIRRVIDKQTALIQVVSEDLRRIPQTVTSGKLTGEFDRPLILEWFDPFADPENPATWFPGRSDASTLFSEVILAGRGNSLGTDFCDAGGTTENASDFECIRLCRSVDGYNAKGIPVSAPGGWPPLGDMSFEGIRSAIGRAYLGVRPSILLGASLGLLPAHRPCMQVRRNPYINCEPDALSDVSGQRCASFSAESKGCEYTWIEGGGLGDLPFGGFVYGGSSIEPDHTAPGFRQLLTYQLGVSTGPYFAAHHEDYLVNRRHVWRYSYKSRWPKSARNKLSNRTCDPEYVYGAQFVNGPALQREASSNSFLYDVSVPSDYGKAGDVGVSIEDGEYLLIGMLFGRLLGGVPARGGEPSTPLVRGALRSMQLASYEATLRHLREGTDLDIRVAAIELDGVKRLLESVIRLGFPITYSFERAMLAGDLILDKHHIIELLEADARALRVRAAHSGAGVRANKVAGHLEGMVDCPVDEVAISAGSSFMCMRPPKMDCDGTVMWSETGQNWECDDSCRAGSRLVQRSDAELECMASLTDTRQCPSYSGRAWSADRGFFCVNPLVAGRQCGGNELYVEDDLGEFECVSLPNSCETEMVLDYDGEAFSCSKFPCRDGQAYNWTGDGFVCQNRGAFPTCLPGYQLLWSDERRRPTAATNAAETNFACVPHLADRPLLDLFVPTSHGPGLAARALEDMRKVLNAATERVGASGSTEARLYMGAALAKLEALKEEVDSPPILPETELPECDRGYMPDPNGQCVNIDECLASPCGTAVCVDRDGSFECESCPDGYALGAAGVKCIDIDECALGIAMCDPNASCKNTEPGAICTCNGGYAGTGKRCADINECLSSSLNPCDDDPYACYNTPGSVSCECPEHFEGTGFGDSGCIDVDECGANNGGCGNSGLFACTNNYGDAPSCADIDECAAKNGDCGDPTFFACTNNYGDAPSCADIDECAASNGDCGDTGVVRCANNYGAGATCTDINECLTGNGGCDPLTNCTNNRAAPPACSACPAGTLDVHRNGTECAEVVLVATGGEHSCAIVAAGQLYCWGRNDVGQVGDGSKVNRLKPVRVGGSSSWQQVALGWYHTCGVDAGQLYCWGFNESGALGDGTNTFSRATPTQIGSSSSWQQVAAGHAYTCGIHAGRLFCWGGNRSGQLGDGTAEESWTPTRVGSSSSWQQIAAGLRHTCGLQGNQLYCWGHNRYYELGDGTRTSSPTPTRVGSSINWQQIATGALSTSGLGAGRLFYWGLLGTGEGSDLSDDWTTPTRVGSSINWQQIAAGRAHNCGLQGSQLYCWGNNAYGQLGDGSQTNRAGPVRVGTSTSWHEISAGAAGSSTCGLDDGLLYCWGNNSWGQLGDGTLNHRWTPTPVRR